MNRLPDSVPSNCKAMSSMSLTDSTSVAVSVSTSRKSALRLTISPRGRFITLLEAGNGCRERGHASGSDAAFIRIGFADGGRAEVANLGGDCPIADGG